MNENSLTADIAPENNNPQTICSCLSKVANVLLVPSTEEGCYRFASKTMSDGILTLVMLKVKDDKAKITVNCEKIVIGSMLGKDIKSSLGKPQ